MAFLLLSLPFAILLAACTLRRAVFLLAALLPARRIPDGGTPSVVLLVPAANEEAGVGRTLDALARLDYPSACSHVVLVDDASDDRTAERFRAWAAGTARRVVASPTGSASSRRSTRPSRGRPRATSIAICDAD